MARAELRATLDAMRFAVTLPIMASAAHTIINHLNDYGIIRLEMGYACAIAVLLFFLMLFVNKAVQRMLGKVGT